MAFLTEVGIMCFLRKANKLPKKNDQPSVKQNSIRDERPDMQNN